MTASFHFLSESPLFGTEKPYEVFMRSIPDGLPKTNCEYTTHSGIRVRDAREETQEITLGDHGFCFLRADSFPAPTMGCFENGEEHKVVEYLRNTVTFVHRHIKADKILCFDWRVRAILSLIVSTLTLQSRQIRRNIPMPDDVEDMSDARLSPLEPATRVHTGQR